jgi:hypothetical protein
MMNWISRAPSNSSASPHRNSLEVLIQERAGVAQRFGAGPTRRSSGKRSGWARSNVFGQK